MEELLKRKGLSRREFHATLAKLGLGFGAVAAFGRPSAAAGELTVLEWAGYDVPELFPSYAEKYGGGPQFSLFGSEEEALQKMMGGFEVDLAHPCSYNIKRWREAGVAGPIDTGRLSNWNDIWGQFRNIPDQTFEGQTFFVPVDCGNSSIVYRTDLVDPADLDPPSWGLLFNEKYAGRLAMYNTDTTLIEIAARVAGMYDDYLTLNEEQLAIIKDMLSKQRELLRFYWDDPTQISQGLASGELVAAYAWNETVKTLKEEGIPVEYMVPQEGILTWVCGFTMHPNMVGDEQAAYDFMNAWISPEAGQFIISEYGYGHANSKSYELVEQATLDALGMSDPKALFDEAAVQVDAEEPYRSRYIELVDQVKAGI